MMSGMSGSLYGYNLYAYCFNNPVSMSDLSGNWPKWLKKAAAVVAVATVVVAATVVTVVTCGPGSTAGVAMVTATATLVARTTEVVALQKNKGKDEGKSASQITKDIFESIYDNSLEIVGLTPLTKSAGIAINHALSVSVEKVFGGTQSLKSTLKSPTGKSFSFGVTAIALISTLISVFSDDPVSRANERGYVLK